MNTDLEISKLGLASLITGRLLNECLWLMFYHKMQCNARKQDNKHAKIHERVQTVTENGVRKRGEEGEEGTN